MPRKGANDKDERGSTDGNFGDSGETNEKKDAERSLATECAEDASTGAKRAPTLAITLARCISLGTGGVIMSVDGNVNSDAEEDAEELDKLGEDDFARICPYGKVEINHLKTCETHAASKNHKKWVSQAKARKRNEKILS